MADTTAPVELVETAPATPPKPKRRFGWIIALAVVLVVLVVGFFVADVIARQVASAYVRERIVEVLKLDASTPVDVDLGSGSLLLQAAAGAIDEVGVTVGELAFGEVIGAAVLTATSVPLDSAKPVDTLDIEVTVGEDSVRSLAGFLSGSPLQTIELQDGVVRVGTEFNLIFVVLPVQVDLVPSAIEGGISFDPRTIVLGQEEISVQELRDTPEFAALAGDLLSSRDFCVAGYLPEALTVDGAAVVGSDLVVSINGDGAALGALSTFGTCPEGQ